MTITCFYCGKNEKSSGLRCFHKFPTDPKECELWLYQMGFEINFEIPKGWKLCSDHFSKDCYSKNTNERMRLLPGSVPIKFGIYHLKCVCCENVKSRGSEKSFRKFPLKNAQLLNKWLEAIGMENFHPNERSLICDDHFEKKCFYKTANGHTGVKVNTFPSIFLKSNLKDGDTAVSIGVNDELFHESETTESSNENVNLTNQMKTGKMENRKRFSTEELPDPKHSKLVEDGNNSSNLMDVDSSLNYAGSSHYIEDDNAKIIEATASNTLTIRHCAEERSYIFFCLLLSFVLWLLAVVIPNLGTKASQPEERMVAEFQAECPNTSETSPGKNCERASTVADIPRRIQLLKHDHHYHVTPRGLKRRYRVVRRRLDTFQRESRIQKQQIVRLQKKIATLSEIVSELRRTRAVSEDGLACLDSIAESDVSQPLSRFLKNYNSIRDKKTGGKRLFKSQRCQKQDEEKGQ